MRHAKILNTVLGLFSLSLVILLGSCTPPGSGQAAPAMSNCRARAQRFLIRFIKNG